MTHTVPVVGGVPRAVVADELIEARYGRHRLEAWRAVQAAGERAYLEIGPIGNFSHDGWQPAIDAAEMLVDAGHAELVLDVGCGLLPEPAYIKVLRERWRSEVVGVDPILGDRRSFPFVQALGDFLPFRTAVFDAVTFVSTLDHMISPLHALVGARQILRPGGWLLVEETVRPVDRAYRRWKTRSLVGPARYNTFHNHAFTTSTLRRTVERAGFTIVRMSASPADAQEMVVVALAPKLQ